MKKSPPDSLRTLVERYDEAALELPGRRARIRLTVEGEGSWDAEIGDSARLRPVSGEADAMLAADAATWTRMARDLRGGMAAYRAGRLTARKNVSLGVGFLAATSGDRRPERLRFRMLKTRFGRVSSLEAGAGEPLVLLHGLGGTKISFLPTIAALAPERRMIAIDLPGFGDSDKPFPAPYDAAFFARWAIATLDALELDRAHILGHSMGGRVALEVGMRAPDRARDLVLMTPSLAWLAEKRWAPYLRFVRPELGALQPTPRSVVEGFVRRMVPGAESTWVASGIDEFLRSFLTPRGRVAFYAAARNIYLEEAHGRNGFWTRLEELAPRSLFIWGRRDQLVPLGFSRHVRRALPAAHHVEVDCGHVPQLERPGPTHAAISRFLRESGGHSAPAASKGAA